MVLTGRSLIVLISHPSSILQSPLFTLIFQDSCGAYERNERMEDRNDGPSSAVMNSCLHLGLHHWRSS